jgi:hypothetical protein
VRADVREDEGDLAGAGALLGARSGAAACYLTRNVSHPDLAALRPAAAGTAARTR